MLTEQSRQSLALKPSSSETYRVETDSGKLTSISSFLHFLINPMKGLYERYFKVCLCGELIKLSFVQLTFQFLDLELLIGELSILKVGFVMCKKLILRDQTFFIGHEEALLEHQQDLLWCSKLSEFLYYLRGVEGSYVTFYHLKEKWNDMIEVHNVLRLKSKNTNILSGILLEIWLLKLHQLLHWRIFGVSVEIWTYWKKCIMMDKPKCLTMYFP